MANGAAKVHKKGLPNDISLILKLDAGIGLGV